MAKKAGGLFALVTLVAAGAAALFLSKKENRQRAQTELKKASRVARAVSRDVKREAPKVVRKLKAEKRKVAKLAKRR